MNKNTFKAKVTVISYVAHVSMDEIKSNILVPFMAWMLCDWNVTCRVVYIL